MTVEKYFLLYIFSFIKKNQKKNDCREDISWDENYFQRLTLNISTFKKASII